MDILKKILVAVGIVLAAYCAVRFHRFYNDGKAFTNVTSKEYYDNGVIKQLVTMDEDEYYIIRDYNEEGVLLSEYSMRDDLIDGYVKHYYPDGNIEQSHQYSSGVNSGNSTLYYPDGSIEATSEYKNGKKNGYLYGYRKNGELMVINAFKDDVLYFKELIQPNDSVRNHFAYKPILSYASDTINVGDTLSVSVELPMDSLMFERDSTISTLDSFYVTINLTPYVEEYPNVIFDDLTFPLVNGIKELKYLPEDLGNYLLFGFMSYHHRDGSVKDYESFEYEIFVRDKE